MLRALSTQNTPHNVTIKKERSNKPIPLFNCITIEDVLYSCVILLLAHCNSCAKQSNLNIQRVWCVCVCVFLVCVCVPHPFPVINLCVRVRIPYTHLLSQQKSFLFPHIARVRHAGKVSLGFRFAIAFHSQFIYTCINKYMYMSLLYCGESDFISRISERLTKGFYQINTRDCECVFVQRKVSL